MFRNVKIDEKALPQVYKVGNQVIEDVPFTLANNSITTNITDKR